MKMTDPGERNAADFLNPLNFSNPLLADLSSFHQDRQVNSVNNSLSSLEGTYLDEIAVGLRRNGRMSAVRRFFCCFVLFELLLVSLIWLTCIVIMDNNNIIQTLKSQILNYKITTSLFDLVIAAGTRFVILLLFYGILHFNTTFFVAFTTFATCIFIIFKVIYYSWSTANQPAFHVIIVLISFVVAWLEAWFFDFKVIPQEQFANYCTQSSERFSESLSNLIVNQNFGNPVLRDFLLNAAHHPREESTANFYSPVESPEHSDGEQDDERIVRESGAVCELLQNDELLQHGKDTLEKAWSLLNDTDWKLQMKNENGDSIYSKNQKGLGKCFLLRTKLNIKAKNLLIELFENVDNFTSWNKTIIESRRIQKIDDHTDITYQVTSSAGSGVISSRDFVNLRHWELKKNALIIAGISVSHANFPSTKVYTRGENGPCCWVMRPLDGESDDCAFEFLLNTNLKGWIPQYIVDNALTSVLLEYSESLRKHCQAINATRES